MGGTEMSETTDITKIKEMVEYFKSMEVKRMGFIAVPSFNGFDIYEFDGDKLRSLVNVLSQDFKIKVKEEQK
jgi:NMD protein affecting ribosome stability and mRNA decay